MANAVVLRGTLQPDGTLQLDQKVPLPPGPVEVVVTAVVQAAAGEDWWQYAQRARRELEASGAAFMNDEELNTHIQWLRQGDAIDELLRRTDAQRPSREKPGC